MINIYIYQNMIKLSKPLNSSPVLRSRFQHPKCFNGPSSSTTRDAPWAHQNMTILRWAAIRSVPDVAICCSGIPWYSLVILGVSCCKVFSCQHKTRVLERKLQNVNLPCIKTARIPRKCQNVQPCFVSTRNMPTDSLPLERVIGMVIKHIQNGYLDRI